MRHTICFTADCFRSRQDNHGLVTLIRFHGDGKAISAITEIRVLSAFVHFWNGSYRLSSGLLLLFRQLLTPRYLPPNHYSYHCCTTSALPWLSVSFQTSCCVVAAAVDIYQNTGVPKKLDVIRRHTTQSGLFDKKSSSNWNLLFLFVKTGTVFQLVIFHGWSNRITFAIYSDCTLNQYYKAPANFPHQYVWSVCFSKATLYSVRLYYHGTVAIEHTVELNSGLECANKFYPTDI